MSRYITRAWRDECRDGWQDRPSCTVHESDDAPADTGLVDQHGTKIFRAKDRVALGFDLSNPRDRVRSGSAKA